MADVRIGISGWTYAPWRGVFYPEGLPRGQELAYASRRLDSIEINGTFYALQRPESFRRWYEETPPGFVFAVKAGRHVTHFRRLRDVYGPLANFFASGVLALGEKLGPILWQFPPRMALDADRFESFLLMLPRDTRAAAQLAEAHDPWMAERAWYAVRGGRPLRHAVEVRHPSFAVPEFLELLRRYGVAAVVADAPGDWPRFDEPTADFVYVRLHGAEELYASGYDPASLDRWAARVRAWADGGRDTYVYFDNDAKVRAPFDAMALAARLGVQAPSIVL